MCLDIDPESVIHKHLVKKFDNESWGSYTNVKQVEKWRIRSPSSESEDAYHSLTMLPSFHISLGAPPPNSPIKTESVNLHKPQLHELIGIINLADIHVSKNQNKKSAWISIDDSKFSLAHQVHDFSFLHSEDLHLHISLANLTGNPHDSIARPEDCVIDTITA
jgi:hypothetical protein